MKHIFRSLRALLFALVLALSSTPSHARSVNPPAQLTSIFKDMSRFETAFKSHKWDKAISAINKIDNTFNQMSPQLKKDIYSYTDNNYKDIINNTINALISKDISKVEIDFIELHNLVFSLISKYDYKIPPIMTMIENYIQEADDAANINNYYRVMSEIDEIDALFYFVEKHLLRIDTMRSDGKKIRAKLSEIKLASINKQDELIKEGIKSLKQMVSALMPEIQRTNKLF